MLNFRAVFRGGPLVGLILLLVGCATSRIDWTSRIGIYTYDQAVLDLGPPDKYAKLQDGTVVAEWLTRRGYSSVYAPFAYSYYPWSGPYGYYGGYPPYYINSYSPDYFLRLIFGPDSKLRDYKNLYK